MRTFKSAKAFGELAMLQRAPRAAAAAATDRLQDGTGAKPLRSEGIDRDVELCVRQAALDVMCAVHHAESPALLAGWGLSNSQLSAIARDVREFMSEDATEARRGILLDADKRKEAARCVATAAFDAEDDAAETLIKIGPEECLRSSIITASLEERQSLATKWATLRWSHAKSKKLGVSSAEVCAEAAELFGDDTVPKDSTVRSIVLAGKAGKSPKKSGQPKAVPDRINAKLAEIVELLRTHKIPVYKHSVILYLTTLVGGSPIGAKLTTDGKWAFKKLDNW